MQVWLNGRVVPLEQAHISPFDRGFLFGDGIYELVRFFDGVGMCMNAHMRRLERSLRLTRIEGFTAADAERAMHAVLQAEGLRDAAVYLQITRGTAPRRTITVRQAICMRSIHTYFSWSPSRRVSRSTVTMSP